MTINVAIVTAEALVLGCDSIASTTEYLLNPFQRDITGNADGSMSVSFEFDHLVPTVTNAWGGVTKMFQLSQCPPVAAVTAGLAKLNGLPMSSLAAEFAAARQALPPSAQPESVEQIASAFLHFMRLRYDQHYAESNLPAQLQEGPLFLVGGFGVADQFPSLYRMHIQENSCRVQWANGDGGAAWGGQSDAVGRTHIGVITKRAFVMLDEPELRHTNVGFAS